MVKRQRKLNHSSELEQKKARAKAEEEELAKNESLFRFTKMKQSVAV